MLFFSAFPGGGGFSSYDDGLAAIRNEQAASAEFGAVIDLVFDESRHDALPLTDSLADVPLRVHASYQREEILAALDYANLQRKPTSMMQGVAYSESLNVDAFFITLKKSEADYSPTTMYRDYPISRDSVSLGIAERHLSRLADRAALRHGHEYGAALLP